jgi:dolichol-phosphate hexosyltransferase
MSNETAPRVYAQEPSSPAVGVPTLESRTQAVVVLPTLNEELGLERTLGELPLDRFGDPQCPVQTIVIDGGSTDGTLDVAKKWNIPVLRQNSKGKGAAVLEAVHWVRDQGIPYVVVLDADATYPPSAILPALSLLQEGADLVTGVRRPVGGPPRRLRDLVHRIGNIALSYTASAMSRRTILDICSGFWAVSTRKFDELQIGSAEFAIEAELVLKSIRAGHQVAQIPIEYRERIGEAKLHAVRDGGAILLSIFQFGRRPHAPESLPKVPSAPALQVLSIALIAELQRATVECRPAESQLANRLALLLHRANPLAHVQVRPSLPFAGPAAYSSAGTDASSIFVSLPAPDAPAGSPPLTVAISPREKELTIRLSSPLTAAGASAHASRARLRGIRATSGRSLSRFVAIFGAVTTRFDFDPARQERTILRANGLDVLGRGGARERVASGLLAVGHLSTGAERRLRQLLSSTVEKEKVFETT